MGTRCVTLLLIEVSNNALVLSQKIKSKLYIKDQFIKSVDTFLIIIIVELKIIIQVTRFIYVPHFKNKNKLKKKEVLTLVFSQYVLCRNICIVLASFVENQWEYLTWEMNSNIKNLMYTSDIRLNREFTTAKLYRLCCMFTPRGGKPTIHC